MPLLRLVLRITVFSLLIALVLRSVPAHSQLVGGTIAGSVADDSGAIVQNAEVVIRNQETGAVYIFLSGLFTPFIFDK